MPLRVNQAITIHDKKIVVKKWGLFILHLVADCDHELVWVQVNRTWDKFRPLTPFAVRSA